MVFSITGCRLGKNMITSLSIGLGGLMIGLLLQSGEYIIYLLYAAQFQMLNYKEGVFSQHFIC